MPICNNYHTSEDKLKEKTIPCPASVKRRLAALFYDTLLIISLWMAIGFLNLLMQLAIYNTAMLEAKLNQGSSLGGIFFYLSLILATVSFFIFFWTRSGQTPGMQAWRIKIQNTDGTLITVKQSLLRCLIAIPAISFLGIGLFWCRLSPSKKSWQDLTSGSQTLFIKKQKRLIR